MKSVKVPQLVSDILRDLRDRHLLLPMAALVVALFLIPMLLKSSAETVPAPAPIVTDTDKASPVSSAVLADTAVDVRNYRKRLEDLKSKNPFKQQFTAPIGGGETAAGGSSADTVPATAESDAAAASAADIAVGDSTAASVGESASSVAPPAEESDVVDGDGGGGPKPDDGEPNDPKPQDVEVVNSLFTHRIDVMVGPEGAPKLKENVKPMTILPDEATPVMAFLGTDEAGKRAAFVISKDATVIAGTGACMPLPENCLYVTLKKGQTATLDFGPDGQKFEIRLLEILDVEL